MRQIERSERDEPPPAGRPIDTVLDLRGLHCPMPVLRTRKALAALGSGCCLVVECTDALAAIDIPHFVSQSGDTLLSAEFREGVHVFSIQKR